MLELADKEIELERGLGFYCLEVGHDDVRQRLTEMMKLLAARLDIRLLMQLHQLALEAADLCIRLNDVNGRTDGPLAFQDRRKHVQPSFGEHLVTVL